MKVYIRFDLTWHCRLAPAAEADPGDGEESSDDDGGCIGPRPPAPGDNSSSLLSQVYISHWNIFISTSNLSK